MEEMTLRLECLRLAAALYKDREPADVLALAGQLFAFIAGGSKAT